MSRLTGKSCGRNIQDVSSVLPDFGKNITIGRRVFINADCHFQDHGGVTLGDGCLIGHNRGLCHARSRYGSRRPRDHVSGAYPVRQNVWVGLQLHHPSGVTVVTTPLSPPDLCVTKDVAANTVSRRCTGKAYQRYRQGNRKEVLIWNQESLTSHTPSLSDPSRQFSHTERGTADWSGHYAIDSGSLYSFFG